MCFVIDISKVVRSGLCEAERGQRKQHTRSLLVRGVIAKGLCAGVEESAGGSEQVTRHGMHFPRIGWVTGEVAMLASRATGRAIARGRVG